MNSKNGAEESGQVSGEVTPAFNPPANILLVDDQPNNLLALEAILEPLGQNLIRARSGNEALSRLLENDFALILMDVQMPDLDGLETAALIRECDKSRHIPIIFLTAHDHTNVQIFKGYSLGAVDYLCKPIVPEVLRSKAAVFVELYQKTERVRQQAQLIQQNQEKELQRKLVQERQHWEIERLRLEAAKEKEANQRKDEFLAMLAHELRNPLAPIFNALHILELNGNKEAPAAEVRTVLNRQVRLLARLVDDLLDVSRITRGKIQLRREPLELAKLLARAQESARPSIEARGHKLEIIVPPEPLWLDADPTRLEQVLANLLNNAAKYTDPAGRITVLAERQEDTLILKVRDTGIGIAPETLPKLFDLFLQADRSLDRAQGGLGIGLTLARRLVEMHGGTIEASSEGLGKGSEFTIRLPLLREPWPIRPVIEPAKTAGQPLRILVVDDSQDTAESLALVLRIEGHEVRMAYDGSAALEIAQFFRPDVAILDIGLPGINGYELGRRIRELESARKILLIALTGYGQAQDHHRSLENGFDHHLVKPVDPVVLQETIARSLYSAAADTGSQRSEVKDHIS
jgi:signal transduction histidine kinase